MPIQSMTKMKVTHGNVCRDYLLEFFKPLGFAYEVDSVINGLTVDILFVEHAVAVLVESLKDDSIDWRIQQKQKGMTAARIKRAESAGYKVFYFRRKELKGKKFKLAMQKICDALNKPVSKKQALFDDPNWEALACKKLGIDPANPKRTPINA